MSVHTRKTYTFFRYGWRTIILTAVLGLIAAIVLSFFQPLRYRSSIRVLITQNVGIVDAYTASRSSERIADDISTLIATTAFYGAVMDSGFAIRASYFPTEDRLRRKLWAKTVQSTVLRGTGLLQVDVYHTSVDQAEQIARAMAFVLTTRANEFVSGGGVNARLVDNPLNSRFPVKPNIPINAVTGLVLGGLAGVALVFINTEKLRRRHQLIHEEW
ncbi:MAG: Wzz/FepE/Etk N-terminal domain-containing protein [bacterium]|nr:Wzz/FepE/Etk N-terminal domain-containing protein [bacterium]